MSKNIPVFFQPRLIIGSSPQPAIERLLGELEISLKNTHPDFIIITPEKEFAIADSRKLIKKSSLSPLFSAHKVILAENFTNASKEAQNSLLKVLEEPPSSTLIILSSLTKGHILPTIISRVITIDIAPDLSETEENSLEKESELLASLCSSKLNLGQKLTLISGYKDAELKQLVKNFIAILNKPNLSTVEVFCAKSLLDINTLTKINVRMRLAVDNWIIALDQLIKRTSSV